MQQWRLLCAFLLCHCSLCVLTQCTFTRFFTTHDLRPVSCVVLCVSHPVHRHLQYSCVIFTPNESKFYFCLFSVVLLVLHTPQLTGELLRRQRANSECSLLPSPQSPPRCNFVRYVDSAEQVRSCLLRYQTQFEGLREEV